jgi:hypothetical protein
MKYIAPQSGLKAFTCPHCGVFARQYHFYSSKKNVKWQTSVGQPGAFALRYSTCEHCGEICLWYFDKMVYPNRGNAPVPNPDMPEDVKNDYEEAASIYTQSPRGAAALLRLAIQKLCVELGGKGKNINDDVKTLVANGLPDKVQKSLDVVRVIGNNAVHPGQIDTDDPEVAGKLFALLNIITDYMVSMPNRIDSMYAELPEGATDAIETRDSQ